jgi:hypothetical protein
MTLTVGNYILKMISPGDSFGKYTHPKNSNHKILWLGTTEFADVIFIVNSIAHVAVLKQLRKLLRVHKFNFTPDNRAKVIKWVDDCFKVAS